MTSSMYRSRALRFERWKLVLRLFDNRPAIRPGELYDLADDSAEERNVYRSRPDEVRRLATMLAEWGESTQDELGATLARAAIDAL